MSGGADSGTIAVMVRRMVDLAIEELGIENVKEKLGLSTNILNAKDIMASIMITAYQKVKTLH